MKNKTTVLFCLTYPKKTPQATSKANSDELRSIHHPQEPALIIRTGDKVKLGKKGRVRITPWSQKGVRRESS